MSMNHELVPQSSNLDPLHQVLVDFAKALLADSEQAWYWLQGVVLTDDMLDVGDTIQELQYVVEEPSAFAIRICYGAPGVVARAMVEHARVIGKLNAAYRASFKQVD